MSVPGWYPDPGKAPGRFRFWDGTTWSFDTTANPGDPPPAPPGPPGRSRRRRAALLAAAALVLVLAVVAVVVVRYVGNDTTGADPEPSVRTSSFDDSTASPAATPTPADTATPSAAAPSASRPCPVGDPAARQNHPGDNRVHGGGLSFPAQRGWERFTQVSHFSWAYDVGGQSQAVEPEWYSILAVGALSTVDGFETPEQAADAVMQCTASAVFYPGFTQRNDLETESVTVGGHPGWRIRSEIQVSHDAATLPGDVVEVIVVDLGSPESLAMFWGGVPIGNQTLISQLDRVAKSLQAD